MDKIESIVALGIIVLILVVFFAVNISSDDIHLTNNIDNGYVRNVVADDVTGSYSVKDDSNSKLLLNEDGTYSLNLNICSGYLELKGVYELRDKNIYLINRTSYEDYENLRENEEFHFLVVDDNTIKLDENLECELQGTLFEK